MPTTTNFVWDSVSDCVLSELDGTNAVQAVYTNEPQHYGGVLSQRRGTTTSTLHADALGTTRALTDSTQAKTDTYLDDAWGNLITSSGTTVNPFRWVGRYGYYQDATTGRIYIRARMYQPMVARWCSVDPLGLSGGINLYLYVNGSPVYRRDPSGLQTSSKFSCDCCKGYLKDFKNNGYSDSDIFYEKGRLRIKAKGSQDKSCPLVLECKHGCMHGGNHYPANTEKPASSGTITICFDCRMGDDANYFWGILAHELDHAKVFCGGNIPDCVALHLTACQAQCGIQTETGTREYLECVECCSWWSCGRNATPAQPAPNMNCNKPVPTRKCWKWSIEEGKYVPDRDDPDCKWPADNPKLGEENQSR